MDHNLFGICFAWRWSFRCWWIKPRPLQVWNLDVWNLEPWKPGTPEPWQSRTLEPWNSRNLQLCNPGDLQLWNPGILQNLGALPENIATLEPWSLLLGCKAVNWLFWRRQTVRLSDSHPIQFQSVVYVTVKSNPGRLQVANDANDGWATGRFGRIGFWAKTAMPSMHLSPSSFIDTPRLGRRKTWQDSIWREHENFKILTRASSNLSRRSKGDRDSVPHPEFGAGRSRVYQFLGGWRFFRAGRRPRIVWRWGYGA